MQTLKLDPVCLPARSDCQLAGAALDVTEPEPLPRDHPLVEHPDAIITPHLGSATVEARGACSSALSKT